MAASDIFRILCLDDEIFQSGAGLVWPPPGGSSASRRIGEFVEHLTELRFATAAANEPGLRGPADLELSAMSNGQPVAVRRQDDEHIIETAGLILDSLRIAFHASALGVRCEVTLRRMAHSDMDSHETLSRLFECDGGLLPHVLLLDNLNDQGKDFGFAAFDTYVRHGRQPNHDFFLICLSKQRQDQTPANRVPYAVAYQLKRDQWAPTTLNRIAAFCIREARRLARRPPSLSHDQLRAYAVSGVPIFLIGDTGTGKLEMAKQIHDLSGVTGSFQRLDCGAVPFDGNFMQTELFGLPPGLNYKENPGKVGRLAAAHNGTLFLDEVHRLHPSVQGALLDAIENKQFSPLGCHQPVRSNFRVISASNDRGVLNEGSPLAPDLLARLRVVDIRLPSIEDMSSEQIRETIGYLIEEIRVSLMAFHEERQQQAGLGVPLGALAEDAPTGFDAWVKLAQGALAAQPKVGAGGRDPWIESRLPGLTIVESGLHALSRFVQETPPAENFRGLRNILFRAAIVALQRGSEIDAESIQLATAEPSVAPSAPTLKRLVTDVIRKGEPVRSFDDIAALQAHVVSRGVQEADAAAVTIGLVIAALAKKGARELTIQHTSGTSLIKSALSTRHDHLIRLLSELGFLSSVSGKPTSTHLKAGLEEAARSNATVKDVLGYALGAQNVAADETGTGVASQIAVGQRHTMN